MDAAPVLFVNFEARGGTGEQARHDRQNNQADSDPAQADNEGETGQARPQPKREPKPDQGQNQRIQNVLT